MTRDDRALCTRRASTTPMNALRKSLATENWIDLPGRIFLLTVRVEGVKENTSAHPDLPRASSPINDNYCVKVLQTGLLVNPVLTPPGLLQKKDISPGMSGCYQKVKLKYVKHVSCVDQLSFVKPLTNVQHAISNLPVGARLQTFRKLGKTWVPVRKFYKC